MHLILQVAHRIIKVFSVNDFNNKCSHYYLFNIQDNKIAVHIFYTKIWTINIYASLQAYNVYHIFTN